MKLHEVDIAIIGGGMVGASLAALLPEHFKVMVIESYVMPVTQNAAYTPSFDARTTALSHSSYEIFKEAGVWEGLEQSAQPIHQVHVSDRGYWGSTLLHDEQENLQALGYVVENAALGKALMHRLQQKSNVNFLSPATVEKLKPIAYGTELVVRKGEDLEYVHTQLAIVADGARSTICRDLGIHIETTDYAHTAIIANITTSEPHNGKAYERFTDNGPMALLPMLSIEKNQYRSALIWTMPHAEAAELMSVSDDVFLQKLQMRFGYRQGQFTTVGQRHAYPLMLSVATEQVRQHIAVLGNAAHSLHPVAGQGFNLALRDVNALCKVLNEAYEASLPIGELPQLQKYFSAQKNDQQLTTLFSDVLPQLFSRPQRLIKMGRGLGLVSLEVLPHLKSSFVRFATGMRVNA